MTNELMDAVTIRKCDNLNKENFWDACKEICPKVTDAFFAFIDTYKQEFYIVRHSRSTKGSAIANGFKFHDLPLEMQVGIIFRFFGERATSSRTLLEVNVFNPADWVWLICKCFMLEESMLANNEKK